MLLSADVAWLSLVNDNHNNQCIFDSKLFPFLVQIMSGMHNVLI